MGNQNSFKTNGNLPRTTIKIDHSALLLGLTLAIFGYIIIYFLYPLLSKDLLF